MRKKDEIDFKKIEAMWHAVRMEAVFGLYKLPSFKDFTKEELALMLYPNRYTRACAFKNPLIKAIWNKVNGE